MKFVTSVVAVIFATCAIPCLAEDCSVTQGDLKFVEQLQAAVSARDTAWIARHVALPLRVNQKGSVHWVKSESDFKAEYDRIFTDKVKAKIAAQPLDTLFKNYVGIMIGHGAVWIYRAPPATLDGEPGVDDYLIFAVNR